MLKTTIKRWAENCLSNMSGLEPDMSGLGRIYPKTGVYVWSTQKLSSQLWFLSYETPNWMKPGHKCHLNIRNKFPNRFSPNPKIFFLILDEVKESRFWGKWEKSIKSKRLEPYIHFKVRGRWWCSSYHPNPRNKSMKNSSNCEIKNRVKNTFKNYENKKHCGTR
jgi:hypothetical protein